jgi:hypothetical protein
MLQGIDTDAGTLSCKFKIIVSSKQKLRKARILHKFHACHLPSRADCSSHDKN